MENAISGRELAVVETLKLQSGDCVVESDDESVVDSDEAEASEDYSGDEELDDDEEGLSWDELEAEAVRYVHHIRTPIGHHSWYYSELMRSKIAYILTQISRVCTTSVIPEFM